MSNIILPVEVQKYIKTNYGFTLCTSIPLVAKLVSNLVNKVQVLDKQRNQLQERLNDHNALSRDAQDIRKEYGKTDRERELEQYIENMSREMNGLESERNAFRERYYNLKEKVNVAYGEQVKDEQAKTEEKVKDEQPKQPSGIVLLFPVNANRH